LSRQTKAKQQRPTNSPEADFPQAITMTNQRASTGERTPVTLLLPVVPAQIEAAERSHYRTFSANRIRRKLAAAPAADCSLQPEEVSVTQHRRSMPPRVVGRHFS
jgi:hypothetical protein